MSCDESLPVSHAFHTPDAKIFIGYFSLYAVFKVRTVTKTFVSLHNGDGEIRTLDPLLARQVLSQLSYAPILFLIYEIGNNGLKWTRTTDLTLIRRAL